MIGVNQVLINRGFKGKLATHWIPWFKTTPSNNYHPMTNYNQNDPKIIAKQLQVMNLCGISVVLATWQGGFSPYQHQATMELVKQVDALGMKFAFVVDPWAAKEEPKKTTQQNILDVFSRPDVVSTLNSKCYISEGAILDFNVKGVDYSKVPQLKGRPVWGLNSGFAWSHDDGLMDPVVSIKQQYAKGTIKVGALCMSFFDGGMPRANPAKALPHDVINKVTLDFNYQNWSKETDVDVESKIARYSPDRAGNYFHDQLDAAPLDKLPYMALETWNDYNERTAWEPWCSAMTGIRIG